ncbi:MAG TPA: outer membrane beta-barrel protein [Caulobacterales bacterium]|nr:outer membrane beta-barrel protein [Caulobacterales bacterium]
MSTAAEAIVRTTQTCSIFAALLMALAPIQSAWAQDDERNVGVQERPRPEYDPQGLRFGGFDLNASLEVNAEHNDNLFAAPADSQSDMIYTAAPQATLGSHWSRHALVVSAGGTANKHDKYGSEDYNTAYLSGYGRLDVGDDTQISGNLRTAREVEPRTDPDSAQTLPEPVRYDHQQASITAQQTLNRFRFSATASTDKYDYKDAGAVDQDFRDHTENAITGRVEVAVSPRLALVGQVTGNKRDYDNAPSLSSDGHTILAGVRLDLTNLIRGEFTAGQFSQNYDVGGTVDGTALAGNIEWFVTGLTTVTFNAHRDVQEATATVATPYVDTRWGVRVDHELLRNVILSADLGRETRKFEPPVIRQDDTDYAGAEIKYLMNRRVALHVSYAHERNDSSGTPNPNRDFDVNRILAGIIFRL